MSMIGFKKQTSFFVLFTFIFVLLSMTFPLESAKKKKQIVLLEAGEKLYKEFKFKEAIEKFKAAEKHIKKKRNRIRLYINLSKAYFQLGVIEETEKTIEKIFKFDPNKKLDSEKFSSDYLKLFNKLRNKKVITHEGVNKKKKKKFPVLLVVAGVAAIVLAVVLLGGKKDSTSTPETKNYAQEVYDSIEWVNIPSGEFQMGDNFNEGNANERPVHSVYLDSYDIAKYEITYEQYDKFCDDTGRPKPSDENWGRGNMPVINVSWDDAKAFCDWLSSYASKTISLPTEAQWEKAARGNNQSKYPWGSGVPNSSRCNHDNSIGKTTSIGSYPNGVSPFGVHDMAGNVAEWCNDWFGNTYYSNSPSNNPTGPSDGTHKVRRGGAFHHDDWHVRSAYRLDTLPSTKINYIGFRIVKK